MIHGAPGQSAVRRQRGRRPRRRAASSSKTGAGGRIGGLRSRRQIAIPEDVRRMIAHELDRRVRRAPPPRGGERGRRGVLGRGRGGRRADRSRRRRARCAELAGARSFLTRAASRRGRRRGAGGTASAMRSIRRSSTIACAGARASCTVASASGSRPAWASGPSRRRPAGDALRARPGPAAGHPLSAAAGEIATQRSAAREAVGHLTRALELLRVSRRRPSEQSGRSRSRSRSGDRSWPSRGAAPPRSSRRTRAPRSCVSGSVTRPALPGVWGPSCSASRGQIDGPTGSPSACWPWPRQDDPGLLIEAHHSLWATRFARGELVAAGDMSAEALALYDPDRDASLAAVYGDHDRPSAARSRRLGARARR